MSSCCARRERFSRETRKTGGTTTTADTHFGSSSKTRSNGFQPVSARSPRTATTSNPRVIKRVIICAELSFSKITEPIETDRWYGLRWRRNFRFMRGNLKSICVRFRGARDNFDSAVQNELKLNR